MSVVSWIGIGISILGFLLMLIFYSLSARPAQMEKKIGEIAYKRCQKLRMVAVVGESLTYVGFFIYVFFPFENIALPRTWPWHWAISVAIGVVISIPSGYLMFKGAKIAGEESIIPKKEHTMYPEDGLYGKIRHPQTVGEGILGLGLALCFNSPMIFLLSIVWIPMFIYFTFVEEKDLVIRYGQAYKDYQARVGMFFPKRK